METGLAARKTGVVFDAMSKGLRDALAVQAAEIRIGDEALTVDNVCVMSDRDLNAYTPVRAFGGYIGIELLRASFVTIDGARSQMRFASRSPGEAGEAGSAMISLNDSTTNGTTTRLVDPLPSIDAMLNGQDSRFRMELGSGGLVFLNTSKSGLNLIKTSPFRYQSLTWTPDGVTTFEHRAAVDVVLGGRHFKTCLSHGSRTRRRSP
jgi:hypothetical protein